MNITIKLYINYYIDKVDDVHDGVKSLGQGFSKRRY